MCTALCYLKYLSSCLSDSVSPGGGAKNNKGQDKGTIEPLTAAYSFSPEVQMLRRKETVELFAVGK